MRTFVIKFILIGCLLVGFAEGYAQDIHFSQFYNSPLSLNPAFTGFIKEDFRASAIYRSQWKTANAQFQTIGFAGDMNFRVVESDKIGVGLFAFSDQLGDGIIKNNSAFFSVSYHKTVDHAKRMKLLAGLQTGYVQKTIDYSTLNFTSQIQNYQIDPTLNSGEDLGKNSFNYVNFNAGVGASYQLNDKIKIVTGLSFFNINNPRENFRAVVSDVGRNTLKGRFSWSGTMDYRLSEKLSLLPSVLVMKQTKVMDFNVGSSLGYWFNGGKTTMVQAGLWYRYSDALIAMSGIKYNNWNLGLSYDFTTSGLNVIKKAPTVKDNTIIGALEVTITYVGYLKRPVPGELTIPCKFF